MRPRLPSLPAGCKEGRLDVSTPRAPGTGLEQCCWQTACTVYMSALVFGCAEAQATRAQLDYTGSFVVSPAPAATSEGWDRRRSPRSRPGRAPMTDRPHTSGGALSKRSHPDRATRRPGVLALKGKEESIRCRIFIITTASPRWQPPPPSPHHPNPPHPS